jgi:hypothetical protein
MKRIVTLAAGAALMLPGTALAQGSPTCQAYNPQLCSVNSSTVSSTGTTAQSTLPFTGLNVGLLAVGGTTLLGTGFAIRRLSSRPD